MVRYSEKYTGKVKPPADLAVQVKRLEKVIRYQVDHHPKKIFDKENVMRHESRMVDFWNQTEMPDEIDKKTGERMLWIHDIPELVIGDLPIVETVNNRELAIDKENREMRAAKRVLNSSDYELLLRHNQASKFWKSENQEANDVTALAAKLVDILDGNVVFHEIVSDYCRKKGIEKISPKMDDSFRYAFDQARKIKSQSRLFEEHIRKFFDRLVELQFNYIFGLWRGVSKSKIPKALREKMDTHGKIYTKKGDGGETGVMGGVRLSKGEQLAVTLGTIDELNSWIGLIRSQNSRTQELNKSKHIQITKQLKTVQNNLMIIGSGLAGSGKRLRDEETKRLEKAIDKMTEELPKLSNFIFPVGPIHVARTVCRRAEREVVALLKNSKTQEYEQGSRFASKNSKQILKYVNRLSDYLFTLARWVNFKEGIEEEVWK